MEDGDRAEPVWQVDLSEGLGELERRAALLRAVEAGLDQSEARLDAYLARRAAAPRAGFPHSFEQPEPGAPPIDPAAAYLEAYLAAEAGESEPHAPQTFGLRETLESAAASVLGQPAGRGLLARLPWRDLRARLDELVETVRRHALHYAWVETRSGETLLARTAVQWGGRAYTIWLDGVSGETVAAHHRSLALAAESRAANLRALVSVVRLAGKIALAAAVPPGPLHLSLAWQFINEVIKSFNGFKVAGIAGNLEPINSIFRIDT